MQMIAIEYPERRLNFFKEQLAAAHRRLDWSMKHNPDWNDHAEKGEVVSFYEWAVQMAEGDCEAVVRCKDCMLYEARSKDSGYCHYWDHEQGMEPNRVYVDDFCSNGDRKGE